MSQPIPIPQSSDYAAPADSSMSLIDLKERATAAFLANLEMRSLFHTRNLKKLWLRDLSKEEKDKLVSDQISQIFDTEADYIEYGKRNNPPQDLRKIPQKIEEILQKIDISDYDRRTCVTSDRYPDDSFVVNKKKEKLFYGTGVNIMN